MFRLNLTPYLIALACIVGLSACGAAKPDKATTHALLVGVSNYPQIPDLSLYGGPNDVELLSQVLTSRGVKAENIIKLSSALDARPTRNNILAALAKLATQAKAGDNVYLHFSGHGSQQPTLQPTADEPDGLNETFLPEDSGFWAGGKQRVENAITDQEFSSAILAIRQRGASVWAVFDTCHAQSMGQQRDEGAAALGSWVAFYASEIGQVTEELRLPEGDPQRKAHGRFSFTLARLLAEGKQQSYRQLFDEVAAYFNQLPQKNANPTAEGNGLDEIVLKTL